jgi:hypothetical protein
MRLIVLLAVAAYGIIAGCGSIGEPVYPSANIPQKITDLVAIERGDQVSLYFTIPSLNTDGNAVRGGIESLDLRVGLNPTNGFNLAQWLASAKRIDISNPPQSGAFRYSVPVRDYIGKEILIMVRASDQRGHMSDWSNIASVNIETPLARPSDLKAQPAPDGVHLSWKAPPNETSFRIFRRADQEKEPSLLATTDKPEYVDTSTEYGKSYDYYVEGIHEKAESETAGPVAVTPKDIFPPAVPVGLTASAGLGAIELAWERNTEPDFKEYIVYRAEDNGPFVQIARGLEGPTYSDRNIESGKQYRYRVAAADQTGNVSEPSQPVQIIAP